MSERKAGDSFPNAKLLRQLLHEQPTPFYLYDAEGLRQSCRALTGAFSWNRGFQCFFPVRMNQNPAILKVLHEARCGVVCCGDTELLLAQKAGFVGSDIVCASLAPSEAFSALAAKLHTTSLIDGEYALPPHVPEQVLLNVRPDDGLRHAGRMVWNADRSKLGMPEDKLAAMFRRFPAGQTNCLGLAMVLRDQEAEQERFFAALEFLFSLAVRLRAEQGITVDTIFLSGGLGACYRAADRETDPNALSARVRESYDRILGPAGLNVRIRLAPGRWLAAAHGVLVTRVIGVKQGKRLPLVLLDTDCSQFLREIAFGANHRMTAPFVPESRQKRMVRAAGSLCDLRDHFSGTYVLPELKTGECVLIRDTGADGRSFVSAYGGSLGCAEFLLEADGSVRCIRARQRPEDVLAAFEL